MTVVNYTVVIFRLIRAFLTKILGSVALNSIVLEYENFNQIKEFTYSVWAVRNWAAGPKEWNIWMRKGVGGSKGDVTSSPVSTHHSE